MEVHWNAQFYMIHSHKKHGHYIILLLKSNNGFTTVIIRLR